MASIGNTPITQSFISGSDQFSGTGAQTAFTLSRTVNAVQDIEVVVANVIQNPYTAYSVSGTTLTFTSAPVSGTNNIYVVYRATNTQQYKPQPLSVSPGALTTGGPVWNSAGNAAVSGGLTTGTAVVNFGSGQFYKDVSGNVGIGTSSPSAKLTVSDGTVRIDASPFSGTGFLGTQSNHPTAFITNNTERMRIDSSGNVGIGTSSPGATLDVNGLLRSTSLQVNPVSGAYNFIADVNGTYSYRAITGGGVAHFYSDSGGTHTLKSYIDAGNGSLIIASDARLKKNIAPARNFLSDVCKVDIVTYNWITEEDADQKTLGYTLQQVETVFPKIVKNVLLDNGDTQKMVSPDVFIPMLIKSIQEQQAMIETLAAKVTALENK